MASRQVPEQMVNEVLEELLDAGLYDWVMLTDLESFMTHTAEVDGVELDAEMRYGIGIEVLRRAFAEALAVAGTVKRGEGFQSWPVDAATALQRIEAGWREAGEHLNMGDVAWIATTAKGKERATAARRRRSADAD